MCDPDGNDALPSSKREPVCTRGPPWWETWGAPIRWNTPIWGDTVNLASRLESLNKEHKTKLLMSETTEQALHGVDCDGGIGIGSGARQERSDSLVYGAGFGGKTRRGSACVKRGC
ncbi:MAG: adenylate/guanylate cyclase domain-containing protein [Acidobacteriota bacterium]